MDYNPTEMRAAAFLSSLGANDTPHSGRSLFAHLTGTWRLLKRHGEREAVCLAGMYHSVYGTNVFKHQTLNADSEDDRQRVRDIIGGEAELLAYMFCAVSGRPLSILNGEAKSQWPPHVWEFQKGKQIWRDLAAIELANLIEQGGFHAVVQYL